MRRPFLFPNGKAPPCPGAASFQKMKGAANWRRHSFLFRVLAAEEPRHFRFQRLQRVAFRRRFWRRRRSGRCRRRRRGGRGRRGGPRLSGRSGRRSRGRRWRRGGWARLSRRLSGRSSRRRSRSWRGSRWGRRGPCLSGRRRGRSRLRRGRRGLRRRGGGGRRGRLRRRRGGRRRSGRGGLALRLDQPLRAGEERRRGGTRRGGAHGRRGRRRRRTRGRRGRRFGLRRLGGRGLEKIRRQIHRSRRGGLQGRAGRRRRGGLGRPGRPGAGRGGGAGFRRASRNAFGARDRPLDEEIVGAADEQEMLHVVAAHDYELALAVKVVNIHDIEPAAALFGSRCANSSPEQKPENVDDEKRGDQERHECSEYREQLRKLF